MRLAPVFRPVVFWHTEQSMSAGFKPASRQRQNYRAFLKSRLEAGSRHLCELLLIPRLKTGAMLIINSYISPYIPASRKPPVLQHKLHIQSPLGGFRGPPPQTSSYFNDLFIHPSPALLLKRAFHNLLFHLSVPLIFENVHFSQSRFSCFAVLGDM